MRQPLSFNPCTLSHHVCTSTISMAHQVPAPAGLRNRHVPRDRSPLPPPVPPKDVEPEVEEQSKPLPPTPADLKPLPPPPTRVILQMTSFWITGFCLWFILVVIMLPVITEKDAFPGLNRWLRKLVADAFAFGKGKRF